MSVSATTVVAADLVQGRARATTLDAGQHLRPYLINTHSNRIQVALVGVCATLLAGDHLQLQVEVGPGVQLELVEPSGTVAYNARGGKANWTASIRVAAGGSLVWQSAPFVVGGGADVRRHNEIHLEDGAVALMAETLVLGRSGEDGGRLEASLSAVHAGRELLVEDLDLRSGHLRSMPGILMDHRVLATTALFGVESPDPETPHETRLSGPGALARSIARHTHETDAALQSTWARWRSHCSADRSCRPAQVTRS